MSIKVGIIGSGPAGMAAALYLKRSGINCTIMEKNAPGGQMVNTFKIENYLGFNEINGADLSLKMFEQIKNQNIEYKTIDVQNIEQKEDKFIVKSKDEQMIFDKLIIASGTTRKKLDIPDIQGVSYCAFCDGSFYKNKNVAVVGGGDSALSEAIYLSNLCDKVYLIVRNEISAKHELLENAKKIKNIEILLKKQIVKVNGENFLTGINLNDNTNIEVSGLFISIGGIPNNDFFKKLGLNLQNGKIIVNSKMQTNLKNVYACGDIINKDYYQISTAINDGIVAALTIAEEND